MTKSILTYEEAVKCLEYDKNKGTIKNKETGNYIGFNHLGYKQIQLHNNRYYVHRLAWLLSTGAWPKDQIDHINGVRDDNRIINLRVVSIAGNQRNATKRVDNTSGVTGVYWSNRKKKWSAQIMVDQKYIYLGTFDDFNEAVKTRIDAESKHDFHVNHGRTAETY